MNCVEYREHRLDSAVVGNEFASGKLSDRLAEHRFECSACTVWEERRRALDLAFGAALVVAPPPELAARLAQLSATQSAVAAAPARPTSAMGSGRLGTLIELFFLVAVGLSVVGLGGVAIPDLTSLFTSRVDDVLRTISLLVDSPLIPYVQSLAITMVEALATLTLVALGLLQVNPEAILSRTRSGSQNS